jgi:P27 family predicted phage terminase small subunit
VQSSFSYSEKIFLEEPMSRPKAQPLGNPTTSLVPAPDEPVNLAERQPLPPVPAHLNAKSAALWLSVWTAGGDAYSPRTDAHIIERYATLHQRRDELMQMLEDDGMITNGSQGQTVLHPAARFLSDVEKAMSGLEDKLGLNPESRLRLGISAIEKESKLDQFLRSAS